MPGPKPISQSRVTLQPLPEDPQVTPTDVDTPSAGPSTSPSRPHDTLSVTTHTKQTLAKLPLVLRQKLDTVWPEGAFAQLKETAFLHKHLLSSPYAKRAVSAYVELRLLASKHPDRLSDEIVHTLARGVAERRTNSPVGTDGLLGRAHAMRAARALLAMKKTDIPKIMPLLARAGKGRAPQAERALILKAIGARASQLADRRGGASAMKQIARFAQTIHGRGRAELVRKTSLIDAESGDLGVNQRFTRSCGPTVAQMLRANADPVYAWQHHRSSRLMSFSVKDSLAHEQRALLMHYGGIPRPWTEKGKQKGLRFAPLERLLNTMLAKGGAGKTKLYEPSPVLGGVGTLRSIARAVSAGRPVAVVGGRFHMERNEKGQRVRVYSDRHAMLISNVRGEENKRMFLVSDPDSGRSRWISGQAILRGTDKNFKDLLAAYLPASNP